LQDIDVEETCHVSSLACRVVARCGNRDKIK
jgi:hypothetical protein